MKGDGNVVRGLAKKGTRRVAGTQPTSIDSWTTEMIVGAGTAVPSSEATVVCKINPRLTHKSSWNIFEPGTTETGGTWRAVIIDPTGKVGEPATVIKATDKVSILKQHGLFIHRKNISDRALH